MMSGARQRATRDLLAPELPRFLDAFATVLSEVPDAADPDACGTALDDTIRCVTQVAQYFAKPAGESAERARWGARRRCSTGSRADGSRCSSPTARTRTRSFAAARTSRRHGEGAARSETAASQLLELLMTLAEHPAARREPRAGVRQR